MAFKIRSAGILKELDRQDEVNRLTQKRQDEREKLYLTLAGPKSYSLGSLAKASSGKGSSTDSLDLSIKALQNPKGYNLGDDLLAPIIASGDTFSSPAFGSSVLSVSSVTSSNVSLLILSEKNLPTNLFNAVLPGTKPK